MDNELEMIWLLELMAAMAIVLFLASIILKMRKAGFPPMHEIAKFVHRPWFERLLLIVFLCGMIQYGATKGTNGSDSVRQESQRMSMASVPVIVPEIVDYGGFSLPTNFPPITNICFWGIEKCADSVCLGVVWPSTFLFTNECIDIYGNWELVTNGWVRIAQVNVSEAHSNAVVELPFNLLPTNEMENTAFYLAADQSDSDLDGLSDAYERLVSSTLPVLADSDNDGVCDGDEIEIGANPNSKDSDGDGLMDGDEIGSVMVMPSSQTYWQYMSNDHNVWSSTSYSDYGSYVINLPCPYTVNGVSYSQARICADGIVYLLDPERPTWWHESVFWSPPSLAMTQLCECHLAIATFCTDLYIDARNWGSWAVYGSANLQSGAATVIDFYNIGFGSDQYSNEPHLFDCQLVLPSGEPNTFYLTYQPMYPVSYFASKNATIGVQCPMLSPLLSGEQYYNLTWRPVADSFNYMRRVKFTIGQGTNPANADSDGDGFSDHDELMRFQTNPQSANEDSDGDGLPDATEVRIGTDPQSADSDCDGVGDLLEFTIGTCPNRIDSDSDGLTDKWELDHLLDPLDATGDDGASGDADGDGLSNIDEYQNDTNPQAKDSDGDGVSDSVEVANGSDPVDPMDGGVAPDESVFKNLTFNIYGDYAAWEMTIVGIGPQDYRTMRITMGAPAASQNVLKRLRKGNSYRLSMRWLNCDGHENDGQAPWYCWQAKIDGLPYGSTYQDYSNIRNAGNELIKGNGWIAENADGLLTTHVHECAKRPGGGFGGGNVAEGKTAVLHVLDFKFVTPAGDPVVSPNSAVGIGQNEFTYVDSTSTLSVLLQVSVRPVLPEGVVLNGTFSLPSIQGALLEWSSDNPNGAATSLSYEGFDSEDYTTFTARAVYCGYPSHNNGFGEKTTTFNCNGVSLSQDFEVFFPKEGVNHPECSTCQGCPNWFYYWRDGGVCGIDQNCRYDCSTSYGYTTPGVDGLIRLGPLAAGSNSGPETYTSLINGYGSVTVTGSGTGILCVAETIEHEQHHLDIYRNFHSQGDDPDSDGIPSSLEGILDAMSTHPNNSDTYNIGFNYIAYGSYGDNEIRCRKIELNHAIPIYPSSDWSNPGCQHKNRFGPVIQQ